MNETEAETIASGCFRNRERIMSARSCGCFYCLTTFEADEIRAWVDDDHTALCPQCGVDAVLAGVTDAAVLRALHQHRFETTVSWADGLAKIRAAGE